MEFEVRSIDTQPCHDNKVQEWQAWTKSVRSPLPHRTFWATPTPGFRRSKPVEKASVCDPLLSERRITPGGNLYIRMRTTSTVPSRILSEP